MSKRTKGRSPHYQGNDSGGYGNPPVSGQFKRGGEPGPGRTPKQASLVASMKRMFGSTVTIGIDGNKMDVPMIEAMTQRTKKEILTGPAKNLEMGFRLAEKYGPQHIEEADRCDTSTFSRDERSILRYLLMRTIPQSRHTPLFGRSCDTLCGTFRIFTRDDGFLGIERIASRGLEEDDGAG